MKNEKLIHELTGSLINHFVETGTYITEINVTWPTFSPWGTLGSPNIVSGKVNLSISTPKDLEKEQEKEQIQKALNSCKEHMACLIKQMEELSGE